MDFRTCPACQASVLEDDVTECPFCGASMTTGKPSGKPQSPSTATAKPATTKPAAAGGKSAAGAPSKPTAKPGAKKPLGSGDPFEVDTSAARKAIPVRPKPAKGFMCAWSARCASVRVSSRNRSKEGSEVLQPGLSGACVSAAGPPEPEPEAPAPVDHSAKIWLAIVAVIVLVGGGDRVVISQEGRAD
ncbi:MAG: hypothetical protein R3B90_04810 [Planctomycetaceae bacterium]